MTIIFIDKEVLSLFIVSLKKYRLLPGVKKEDALNVNKGTKLFG